MNKIKIFPPSKIVLFIFLLVGVSLLSAPTLLLKNTIYKKVKTKKKDIVLIDKILTLTIRKNSNIGFSSSSFINKLFPVPKKISVKRFKKDILQKYSKNSSRLNFLLSYYQVDKDKKYFYLTNYTLNEYYTLIQYLKSGGYKKIKNILSITKIKKKDFDKVIKKLTDKKKIKYLNKYYTLDKKVKFYKLQPINTKTKILINQHLSFIGFRSVKWLVLIIVQFIGIVILILLYFSINLYKVLIPLLIIISGGIGNFLDRVLHGFVIDYISLPFLMTKKGETPFIFNTEDIFIIGGSIALIIVLIFFYNKKDKKVSPAKTMTDFGNEEIITNNSQEEREVVETKISTDESTLLNNINLELDEEKNEDKTDESDEENNVINAVESLIVDESKDNIESSVNEEKSEDSENLDNSIEDLFDIDID